jgi:hypothetical protein
VLPESAIAWAQARRIAGRIATSSAAICLAQLAADDLVDFPR